MKVRLVFIALESERLPADGGDCLELDDGASLADALRKLGLGDNPECLTLLNDASIPASRRDRAGLADGDTVTLFSPIKGG